MDNFVHVANVLYLLSYLVRDILWLRLLTVVAALFLMPFFYFQDKPLIAPILWNVLFIGINLFQIYLLLIERRPVLLTETQQHLHRLVFRALTPREMLKLLTLAVWKEADAESTICDQGVELDDIMLLYRGNASVRIDGNEVAALHEGQFVGEMSYLTGAETTASVVATENTRYVAWSKDKLKHFLEGNPDLRAALQMIIGVDLVAKLKH